jgi:hypothetical protein
MATVGALATAAATFSGIEPAIQHPPSAAEHSDLDVRDPTVNEDVDRPEPTPDEQPVHTPAMAPDELPDLHALPDRGPLETVARRSARWLAGTMVLVILLAAIVVGLAYVVGLYMHS